MGEMHTSFTDFQGDKTLLEVRHLHISKRTNELRSINLKIPGCSGSKAFCLTINAHLHH